MHPTHVLSSGQVANLLGIPEPHLGDLVRRGKVVPSPEVVAGRRAWLPEHVAAAARALGIPIPTAAGTRGRTDAAASGADALEVTP